MAPCTHVPLKVQGAAMTVRWLTKKSLVANTPDSFAANTNRTDACEVRIAKAEQPESQEFSRTSHSRYQVMSFYTSQKYSGRWCHGMPSPPPSIGSEDIMLSGRHRPCSGNPLESVKPCFLWKAFVWLKLQLLFFSFSCAEFFLD